MDRAAPLSKSDILSARQCARRLWLQTRRPELAVFGSATARRMTEGRALNRLLHELHPDGELIRTQDPAVALAATAETLAGAGPGPLFEAAFSAHGALIRADMVSHGSAGLHLTEVKSATRVKTHHLDDCAVQTWVIREAGYPVEQTQLAHIDTRFRYRGDGDYGGLLRAVDVTERVTTLLPSVPGWVAAACDARAAALEPAVQPGAHCTKPYPCPFSSHCRAEPTGFPVEILPGAGRLAATLRSEGFRDVRDIPAGRLRKPIHERIRQATVRGRPYIGPQIRQLLAALPYPRLYLDFEAIQFAIPRWVDTQPYEQIPFQWSCHIEDSPGELRQLEFLETSGGSPLQPCATALLDALAGVGPIFSYSRFERTVIHRLSARFPSQATRLDRLAQRLVDLLPLLKAHYYHPAMRGSYSLKAVLPTVAPDLSYHELGEVHDGIEAQTAYQELIDPATAIERRAVIAHQLKDYCRMDTRAMVEIVRFFEQSKPG